MIIRKIFQGELKKLHDLLFEMNDQVKTNLHMMCEALINSDFIIAQNVIDNDDVVDNLEIKIEEFCIELLIKQQPVAGDLRQITAALKITTDLERISDYSSYVCEHYLNTEKIQNSQFIKQLSILSHNSNNMFNGMIDGFLEQNCSKLESVVDQDTISDEAFANLKRAIVSNLHNISPNQVINLILIGKALERMADHITNVCDWVHFNITGNIKN